ncbi:UDP-Glycosyltransferase/glycogen phosphorylase [Podospora fimiseda]|uniref:UDP-Glycosyltransferase/glycogen phosphorylase n=1 Tax=Podospora fimiseda TaxID=252190 RepID=A0AAN7BHN8_9PEZI|nr:UDP-Glycosyltransferase/glycogen phosphorylase [Podospora fimiseda]
MTIQTTKLTLLFMAHPLTGHITPTLRIASHFSLNHNVYFLGPTAHKQRIKSSNCKFLPFLNSADINDLTYYTPSTSSSSSSSLCWQSRALLDFQNLWINPIPDYFRSVQSAISHIQLFNPEHFLIITESMFFGILPLFISPPPSPSNIKIKIISLSIMTPFIRSPEIGPGFSDTLPFLPDLDSQLLQAAQQWSIWETKTSHLKTLLNEKLIEAGVSPSFLPTQLTDAPFLNGFNYTHPSISKILQLGVPSFFYPRQKGFPSNFQFLGCLPPATEPSTGWPNLPSWWQEIKSNTTKKIVLVAQGTVETDPHDLIIPAITAMSSREDVLVVAILGRKDARLPNSLILPGNARVTDYLHYDAILPFANAWVHNGGYGAVQHGISHGVPMAVTGEGQDKADNAKRIAWSGIGINLGGIKPDAQKVKKGLEKVLDEKKYKERVMELLAESNRLDCLRLVEKEVLTVAEERSWY